MPHAWRLAVGCCSRERRTLGAGSRRQATREGAPKISSGNPLGDSTAASYPLDGLFAMERFPCNLAAFPAYVSPKPPQCATFSVCGLLGTDWRAGAQLAATRHRGNRSCRCPRAPPATFTMAPVSLPEQGDSQPLKRHKVTDAEATAAAAPSTKPLNKNANSFDSQAEEWRSNLRCGALRMHGAHRRQRGGRQRRRWLHTAEQCRNCAPHPAIAASMHGSRSSRGRGCLALAQAGRGAGQYRRCRSTLDLPPTRPCLRPPLPLPAHDAAGATRSW